MGTLSKKLKKANKIQRFFYHFTMITYLACFGYFIYGLLQLARIETLIRIIVIAFFAIWFFIYILAGAITILSKKKKTFIFLTIFSLLLCPLFVLSSFYINKVFSSISIMNRNTVTYTTNLISLKDSKITKNGIIGMIKSKEDIEGNLLAKKLIEKEKLNNKIEYYDEYTKMLQDLYNGEIEGCFVSSNYAIIFGNTDDFANIEDEVKVQYSYSEDMKNADNKTTNNKGKDLTEPFTILLMGVDSEKDGLKANQAFNGDTLILVTFNPKTLNATMFSIPRDTWVPIACNNNRENKINSSAAYGSSCVIKTIQNLTGINIDYYAKVNFKGVVDLVDSLGGVTVEVERPDFWYIENGKVYQNKVCEQDSNRRFGKDIVCMDLGLQTLTGEQALAYARCRHLYAISDIARNQHQQQIIEAIVKKIKELKNVSDFEKILNAVSRNIETNIKTNQMLSLYNVAKNMLSDKTGTKNLSIQKTYLAYYNLGLSYTSALGYYKESLNEIVKAMKVNLELEKPEIIKTFEISYSENYTTPLIGYGITGNKKQVVPNYIGYDSNYVSNWCQNNGISCYFNRVDSAAQNGQILTQSVSGVLLDSISSISFSVSNGSESNPEPIAEKENKVIPKKEEPKEEPKEEQKKEEPEPIVEPEKKEEKEPETPSSNEEQKKKEEETTEEIITD